MAEDLMRYDLLAQDALRGVVRSALAQVAHSGLPGEHHLFIALDTRHPGVQISDQLRQKYPEEITIVLQHQYWNLDVGETEFSVELTFNNVLEKLVVPYTAIKGFFDPAVQFGLQFETKPVAQSETVDGDLGEGDAGGAAASEPPAPKVARKTKTASAGGKDPGPAKEPAEGDARKVVSLDQFRKK